MKLNEVKKSIKNAAETEGNQLNNSVIENIINACENVSQIEPETKNRCKTSIFWFKRLSIACGVIAAFIFGIFSGIIVPDLINAKEQAHLYLDVNPSIQVKLDRKERIKEVIAGNEDGEIIIEDLELNKIDLNTGLHAIVGSMYTHGYLTTESNSILVSVDYIDESSSIGLNEIIENINSAFDQNPDMECSIIAQKIEKDDSLESLAEQYGISVGKMKLILKIIEQSDYYTEEDIAVLSEMNIHELHIIYKSLSKNNDKHDKPNNPNDEPSVSSPSVNEGNTELPTEDSGNEKPSRDHHDDRDEDEDDEEDVISGKPGGFIEAEDAYEKVLEHLQISEEQVEWAEVIVLFGKKGHENDKDLLYLVSIKLKDSDEILINVVNAKTGEIMEDSELEGWEDRIPHHDHGDKDDDKDDHHEEDHKDPEYPPKGNED